MTTPREFLPSIESNEAASRLEYLFNKKIFLIEYFDSMRNYVDQRCQSIADDRLKESQKFIYENYFRYILQSPTPKIDMKKVFHEQQTIIDKINTFERNLASLDPVKEPKLIEFGEIIHNCLFNFSKYFYSFIFDEIDMNVKSLLTFSEHMRFYPEVEFDKKLYK